MTGWMSVVLTDPGFLSSSTPKLSEVTQEPQEAIVKIGTTVGNGQSSESTNTFLYTMFGAEW